MYARSRVATLVALIALLAGAVAFIAPSAGAQEGNQDSLDEVAADDVALSSEEEVMEYIRATEDYEGQFSPHIIPPAAFTPDGFDPDSQLLVFGAGHLQGSLPGYGCVAAPVHLPAGSVVVNILGYLYDNDPAVDLTLNLYRARNALGVVDTMASVGTTDQSTSIQARVDASILFPVISPSYSYYLATCLNGFGVRLHGVRIMTKPADDVFTVSGLDAQVEVVASGPEQNRTLLDMVNAGRSRFRLQDVTQNNGWLFGTRGGGFEINRAGSGGTEMRFFEDGRVIMGAGPATTFDLSSSGNLTITGALTQNSDVNAKTGIRPVDMDAILAAVEGLDISTWQYRSDPARVRHLGPMAQDFHAAFGLAGTDTGISTLDTSGVALAAIQALSARNADLEARVAELESLIAAMQEE